MVRNESGEARWNQDPKGHICYIKAFTLYPIGMVKTKIVSRGVTGFCIKLLII